MHKRAVIRVQSFANQVQRRQGNCWPMDASVPVLSNMVSSEVERLLIL
jgi:hypothetical protein